MKKIFVTIIASIMTVAGATNAHAEFRWGATAGLNVSSLKFKQKLVPVHNVASYSAGIMGEMIFPGIGIGLNFGLLYNQQGAKVDIGSREVWSSLGFGNEHVMLHNISIPVHLRCKYTRLNGLEDKIAPIIYGGPEFNIQAGHSNAGAFDTSGGDLGLSVGLGAELYKKWQITAGYTWGMTYALKTKLLDNFSAQSRQWNIKVAYYF